MRAFFLSVFLLAVATSAGAVDAPPGQIQLNATQILRGRFTDTRQISGMDNPITTSGTFVVAPAYGLLWNIEQPLPTTTTVTQNGMVQSIGGMSMKLPVKNLRRLYDMVGGALKGDWNGLAADYTIRPTGDARHWQMLMTQRPGGKHSLTFTTITVSGGRYVENIAMMEPTGTVDTLDFTDEVLSGASLSPIESAAFTKVAP